MPRAAATSAPGCAAPRQGRSRISRPSSAAIGPAPIALPTWSSTTRPPRRTSPRKPSRRPRPRLLRPPPSLRPLAAPDRGQPGDRRGSLREGAAAGGRRRSPPGCAGPARFASADACLRGGRGARRPLPDHRAVIVLRYLLEYTPGEIASMLGLPRGTVNPVSAAAWTRSRQMSWRSVNDGSGAAQPRYRPRPEEAEAGERAWAVVQAAYGTRERVPWIERNSRAVLALRGRRDRSRRSLPARPRTRRAGARPPE